MRKRQHAQVPEVSVPSVSGAAPIPGAPGDSGPPEITHEKIATLAYRLWEDQGRPEGMELEIWCQAERQLRGSG